LAWLEARWLLSFHRDVGDPVRLHRFWVQGPYLSRRRRACCRSPGGLAGHGEADAVDVAVVGPAVHPASGCC
jgi:hypothetical protein